MEDKRCGVCGSELREDELGICDNCKASMFHTEGFV